ncbi:MAG: hypothetical protein ACC661_08700, partial [Verrucomicrobiales bacterium]
VTKLVAIDVGTIYATVARSGSTILLDNIEFALSEIDIDPANLAAHNRALVQFSALLGVDSSPEEGRRFAQFHLEGGGTVTPFDAASGAFNPRLVTELAVLEGSYIDVLPTMDAVAGLLEKLDEVGVDLGEIDLRSDFKERNEITLDYYDGNVKTLTEIALDLQDFALFLAAGSWVNVNSGEHLIEGRVYASVEKTEQAKLQVDAFLKQKAKNFASPQLRDMLMQPILDQGRIALGFRSQGQLANPRVDLLTKIGTLSDVLKLMGPDGTLKQIEEGAEKAWKDIRKALGF